MKKMMLLGALLLGFAAAGNAQESRQDISLSATEVVAPEVNGLGVFPMHTTLTTGELLSYRYMLTPRSALELNYSFAQYTIYFHNATYGGFVHTRQEEASAAYVYSRTYGRYNPFVEAGIGGLIFTPIKDNGTSELEQIKQTMNPGGLFGAGVAYELSPSFDIRAEYRGFVTKAPDFGYSYFKTNRYYVNMMPSIGIAYHF